MAANIRKGMILGMGNPLLDMTAVIDKEFLDKYNLKPNNAIMASEEHRPLYNEMRKFEVEFTAGGSVLNSLRVAQWIIETKEVAVYMGCIGKDEFGSIQESRAKEDGVNVRYQFTDKEPTGTCAVLITDQGANRSLCANLAAASCFTNDHIHKPENWKLIEEAKYFYISGFFIPVSQKSILDVGKHALEKNKYFMMNLSAPFVSQAFNKQLMEVLPYIDILFGNETEAAAFAKEQEFQTDDLKQVALKITNLPKLNKNRSRIAIITQGDAPVLVAKDGVVTEFPATQLSSQEIVDTNGAGDAFVGGFLSQLVQDKSLETCVKCGIWAATKIIRRSGCTFEGKSSFC